jgi:hypothetical protein
MMLLIVSVLASTYAIRVYRTAQMNRRSVCRDTGKTGIANVRMSRSIFQVHLSSIRFWCVLGGS